MRLDLHVHTTYSDGDMTPQQVAELAKSAGLDGVAITDHDECRGFARASQEEQWAIIDQVCRRNVDRSVEGILSRSEAIAHRVQTGDISVIGGLYDVCTGRIEFLDQPALVAAH